MVQRTLIIIFIKICWKTKKYLDNVISADSTFDLDVVRKTHAFYHQSTKKTTVQVGEEYSTERHNNYSAVMEKKTSWRKEPFWYPDTLVEKRAHVSETSQPFSIVNYRSHEVNSDPGHH